jgi:hypothetical protein
MHDTSVMECGMTADQQITKVTKRNKGVIGQSPFRNSGVEG